MLALKNCSKSNKGAKSELLILKILELMVLAILITCCTLQAWESLVKYFKNQTTIATEFVDEEEGLLLPALSFCPGLKNISLRPLKVYQEGDITPFDIIGDNPTESDMMEFWTNLTYQAKDAIILLRSSTRGGNYTDIKLNEIEAGFHSVINTTIVQVSTVFGKCYSLHFHSKYPTTVPIRIDFNMINRPTMDLLIHEPHAEIGLFFNYWPTPVLSRKVTANIDIDLSLKFTVRKELSNCEPGEDYSLPKCVYEWSQKAYLNSTCPKSNYQKI
jgi:hypothetical protein